jgi:hypothetical protein
MGAQMKNGLLGALAICGATIGCAQATETLYIALEETGVPTYSVSSALSDPLNLGRSTFGNWKSISIEADGQSFLSSPALGGTQISAQYSGTVAHGTTAPLTIWVVETGVSGGYSGANAQLTIPSFLGVHGTPLSGWSVTENTYISPINANPLVAGLTGQTLVGSALNSSTAGSIVNATVNVSLSTVWSISEEFVLSPPAAAGAFKGGTILTTGIPEPSTWAMMLIGLGALGFAGYRKREALAALA